MLLNDLFARSVAAHGERPAVDVPPGTGRPARQVVTYRELAAMAEAIAARLRELVQPEAMVVLLLPRSSPWSFAAQLAVLQVGGAHVGVDASFPDAHLRHIVADAKAVAVITDATAAARCRGLGVPVIELPLAATAVAEPDAAMAAANGDRLAYAIYTSGTTGVPKGVLIEHRGAVNLITQGVARFALGPGDRIAQGSSFAYDSSIEETWLALASGATVVVLDDETVRSGPDLVPWLRRERVTVFCPPPTLLRAMDVAKPRDELPDLRLCYVGGEALPPELASSWGGALWLENGYGPTECTVTVVRGRVLPDRPVTIGTPVPPHQAHVLDAQLQPVAEGEAGELCIAGPGLARGYLGQEALTAQRFPHLPGIGRVYRTGDLVRRQPDGELTYHGRIDAQVKLRGHRLELEAIESVLARCPGVREVACRVQGEAGADLLAAHVVPDDQNAPPSFAALAAAVRSALPAYAVPQRFALCQALPRTVGGKLDRKALPEIAVAAGEAATLEWTPTSPVAAAVRDAVAAVLRLPLATVGPDHDFFALGGDSLRAALLVSRLRREPGCESIAVRDVYRTPTVAGLASRLQRVVAPAGDGQRAPDLPFDHGAVARPLAATCVQLGFLVGLLLGLSTIAYVVGFVVMPALLSTFSLTALLLIAPWLLSLGFGLWTLVTLWMAVATKELLIGRYRPLRTPAWSAFHLRHWIVVRMVRLVPWTLLEGTEAKNVALRALGARIGKRVHIHRGVDVLNGGWDLLELGDDVSVLREVHLGLAELDAGELVIGPVRIAAGATLETRASIGPDTSIGAAATVRALSCVRAGAVVPAGEVWDGVPAARTGPTPAPAAIDVGGAGMSPWAYTVSMLSARLLHAPLLALPLTAVVWLVAHFAGVDGVQLVAWLCGAGPSSQPGWWWLAVAMVTAALPVQLLASALILRWTPAVPVGTHARWSWLHLRLQLRTELVDAAGTWLSGTLFWPMWLRLAGMRIGRDCEVSTILDVLPEHTAIGSGSFLADGVYFGVPRIDRGRVTVAPAAFGERSFVGNHVVVAAGERLAPDLVLGVSTTGTAAMPADSGWFGQPAFALPRREIIAVDRRLTHDPGPLRWWNRCGWEAARLLLPALPMALLLWWFDVVAAVHGDGWMRGTFTATWASLVVAAVLAGVILALKWLLLGRVRPGQHGLWSCWASRWDFHYVVWQRYGRALLQPLEGTLLLPWYLRAMGMRIGRGCVLGDGFAQVVDPDMLTIEDGATVHALFQAHSFEDRVLKIDHVRIGKRASVGCGTVILYGADIGDDAHVERNSVVMKREVLLPGHSYIGAPTAPCEAAPGRAPVVAAVGGEPAPAAEPRDAALDVARGLAVLGMIWLHFVPTPVEGDESLAATLSTWSIAALEGVPAALFVLLAGMAWGSAASFAPTAGTARLRTGFVVRRALALVVLGVPFWIWCWPNDVMVPMAMMLMGTAALLRAGRIAVVAVIATLLAVAPVLVTVAADVVAADWNDDGTHAANHGFGLVTLRWYVFDGTYPLLPWLLLPLLGAVIAISGRGDRSRWRRWLWLAAPMPFVGMGLDLFAFWNEEALGDVAAPLQIEWQPTSIPFLLSNGGFALAIVALLERQQHRGGLPRALAPLAAIGRMSLSHYLAHIVLVYAPMRHWWPEEDWSIGVGVAAALGYAALALPVSWWWGRRGGRGPIEALLRRWCGSPRDSA
ncbi:MAG: amino acid adenylation domain-containing protein [Planctomycetes bacterium]|nr:amino acid adenylation domain-containing protein [Planctomycetota bacterium]